MIFSKRILITPIFISLLILCSGWGSGGHRKINERATGSFPESIAFLKASWTIILTEHGSDADKRKAWDPDEGPKHYIDIDDYPEFILTGKIPQSYDSVCALHGESFVVDKGILPWATLTAFDSLRNCFERKDWNKAGLFAADLGHYIGDAHQPLHITRNYNGQYTNQNGVHSRYETGLINRYLSQIEYPDDSVSMIMDVRGYVFGYIYYNYLHVDSLLRADSSAHASAGSITSDQYYSLFWEAAKGFTTNLLKRSSKALAALIYTAWMEAGSPVITPSATDEFTAGYSIPFINQPNPFCEETTFLVQNVFGDDPVSVKVYDTYGKFITTLYEGRLNQGLNKFRWNASNFCTGIYYVVLTTGSGRKTLKAVLFD